MADIGIEATRQGHPVLDWVGVAHNKGRWRARPVLHNTVRAHLFLLGRSQRAKLIRPTPTTNVGVSNLVGVIS